MISRVRVNNDMIGANAPRVVKIFTEFYGDHDVGVIKVLRR